MEVKGGKSGRWEGSKKVGGGMEEGKTRETEESQRK